ncbi:MAG: phospholipase D-like domain-containing protein, partial [Dehalococcoidia bacterium]
MPRIFDNIQTETSLLPALHQAMALSYRSDFCVGYFNLRGWRLIDGCVEGYAGDEGAACRLLVGMQESPADELRRAISVVGDADGIDQQTALRLRREAAQQFREQLVWGAPSNADEAGLRRLRAQLRERKLVVKLFLRHQLHAKLYLVHREDPINPMVGFLGSSNLTLAGLKHQGELNVDVLDH